ncbi:MAG: DUF4124 domain-containing protein [Candidatus Dadabacteria bacterium]|nr:MAG: DUF4124 domain-containing protein [Candidatus Dadabacteria bacterium]
MRSRINIKHKALLYIIAAACVLLLFQQYAVAGPIYVYRQADGTVHFSSKPPPAGVSARVFTAKSARFSVYRSRSSGPRRLYISKYRAIINRSAREFGLETALIRAVIHAESGFRPSAVSPKGALGLMQILPVNLRRLGIKDPFSPVQNIRGGTRYLANLIRKYNGNLKLALAAYNAGEDAVRKYKGIPPYRETVNYVKKVLSLRQRYSRVAS